MNKQYQPKKVEKRIYQFWEQGGFFSPDKFFKKKSSYSVALPPPNITGSLHMGHALNAVIQDILIRQKRMQGFKTLWLPGTDHAGIATQNVVEKELKKQGKTRFDLGRKKFLEKVWQWKEKYGNIILNQLKLLGASCDWSRTRFTMDPNYTKAVEQEFFHYYKKGLIYRAKRAVNWCPRCQTSLSDLELEYQEEKTKLWFIKYKLKNKSKCIIVATTRPETMLGDTAVAVNPKDKRYKNFIGETVIVPIISREIPIVADGLINPKFGTGAVKITPAHDLSDYQVAQRQGLGIIQVIDKKARMSKSVPLSYQGLKIKEAREKIFKDLQKIGLLEKTSDYIHQIPKCYRCSTTVEIIPSWQWFLKMEKLAKLAIDAAKKEKIVFSPKRWRKAYLNWLENIQDWCISRQLWWGQRLPVWHCQTNNKYFVSLKKPKKCLICEKCKPKQVDDVFDTWFSSALWPFATLGWPKKTQDLKKFYPLNTMVTARDIINLWIARIVFSSLELLGKIPFKNIIIHATILAKDGRRMSKSLGTGVDPLDLVEQYGADATRFGLAWQITELQDIRFDESNIIAGKKFCNKIWNASRFITQQIGKEKMKIAGKPRGTTSADKKILKDLDKLIESANKNLEKFQFGKAIQEIYDFFWHKFCDVYIETAKSQINKAKTKKQTENTKKILLYTLTNSLKLLHPFTPFITEEIYQRLPLEPIEPIKKALIIQPWPK